MTKRRRTDKTMTKRRRTDNTMTKRRRTDSTMAKRKSTKRKTTIYKTYTQNKRSGNTNPTKNRG
jgi:hypothetical protein